MTDAKRHHYVPQFHLRAFASNPTESTPRLWAYSKARRRTLLVPVRDAAQVVHHNRVEGDEPQIVERGLANLDGAAAAAIRRLLDKPRAVQGEDRDTLALYVASLRTRNPKMRAEVSAVSASVYAHLALDERMVDGESEAIQAALVADPPDGATSHDEMVLMSLTLADQLAPIFRGKWWTLAVLDQPLLLICDAPVGLHDPARPDGAGLNSSTAEIMVPLTPRHCLIMHGDPSLGDVLPLSGQHAARFADVCNSVAARSALDWVYASSQNQFFLLTMRDAGPFSTAQFPTVVGLDGEVREAITARYRSEVRPKNRNWGRER